MMPRPGNYERFATLTFEDFRALAQDPSLSQYEKIGFPDEYRQGFEEVIYADIRGKIRALNGRGNKIADIGPGCSNLPLMIAQLCKLNGHELTWIDSDEMLGQLPQDSFIKKVIGQFPMGCETLIEEECGTFDAVLVYSVLHYVMPGHDIFEFLDDALRLLAPGGQLLIGDIPNVSMRKRFFSAESGASFHQRFTNSTDIPVVEFNVLEPGRIDDSVVLSLLMRARSAGFHAYVVPQADLLPMANRREDIFIVRP